jgi:hypothetical protein
MSDDNYYDEFLETDEPDDVEVNYPAWVSPKNSSQKAYDAIGDLKKEKRKYIRNKGLKSHYIKSSNYQIAKSEVAKLVGSKPQPLFNSCSYSASLKKYLDSVNAELDLAREGRIKSKGGLRQKRKGDLVKELQEAKINNESLLEETVDKLFEKTINSLPLDVRRKLGIKI